MTEQRAIVEAIDNQTEVIATSAATIVHALQALRVAVENNTPIDWRLKPPKPVVQTPDNQ